MSDSPATEDVKAKFREALAKKRAHGGTDVSDHSGQSKVGRSGARTSAAQQMFRRKSGG